MSRKCNSTRKTRKNKGSRSTLPKQSSHLWSWT